MARLAKAGKYAVVETNHVSAVRTGNIKAQYPLIDSISELENGAIVTADDATKEVRYAVSGEALYLHASEERIYEDHLGRDSFVLTEPNLPRVLKLEVGDIFETNAIDLGAITYGATAKTYGAPSAAGIITLSASAGNFVVSEWVTLPNGEKGAKFAVLNAVMA